MRHFRALAALALAASALAAAPAWAHDGQVRRASLEASGRAVFVCATDQATRRAFAREHGSAPVFITAQEALSVRPSDPAWESPRCMTAREHARYREGLTTYARVP